MHFCGRSCFSSVHFGFADMRFPGSIWCFLNSPTCLPVHAVDNASSLGLVKRGELARFLALFFIGFCSNAKDRSKQATQVQPCMRLRFAALPFGRRMAVWRAEERQRDGKKAGIKCAFKMREVSDW
jgi:hypothetical protein